MFDRKTCLFLLDGLLYRFGRAASNVGMGPKNFRAVWVGSVVGLLETRPTRWVTTPHLVVQGETVWARVKRPIEIWEHNCVPF